MAKNPNAAFCAAAENFSKAPDVPYDWSVNPERMKRNAAASKRGQRNKRLERQLAEAEKARAAKA